MLSEKPSSRRLSQNDRPPENRLPKVEPGPQSVPRDGGRSFVKYVVTVVFDREKAASLSNKRASDLHGELCRAFELLRLPYPAGHNMEQPNLQRGSITVWWYTQNRYTVRCRGRRLCRALLIVEARHLRDRYITHSSSTTNCRKTERSGTRRGCKCLQIIH